MTAIHAVNLVQLTIQDGLLSLKHPMQFRHAPLAEEVSPLRQLLEQENAESLLFQFKSNQHPVRVEVCNQWLKWSEKHPEIIHSYLLNFASESLEHNGKPASESIFLVVSNKIKLLIRELENDTVKVLKKERR
ncbi:hypothetical protein EB093_06695 [bacterium]|nr:hypothetical protein [bacterium]